ncbi:MAG: Fe2+-dependent dioxygenase [Cyanobacteria bacterium]|nr:Fe2+-dependent dioxygenase [Cyanobacteriota bacterium]
MIISIANVLGEDELAALEAQLANGHFIDGKDTAGWHARLVKHNAQLAGDDPALPQLRAIVQRALLRNTLFQMAAIPKAIGPILFSRYDVGMAYGRHVDNAFMGSDPRIRSDLSLTLFLRSPTHYGGGELVIETTQGEEAFKLEAGAMVLYPSSTLHRVEPVESGVRLVAVAWVQSLVKDPLERELLFDLETARQGIFAKDGKTAEFDLLSKSYANLLRRWGEL